MSDSKRPATMKREEKESRRAARRRDASVAAAAQPLLLPPPPRPPGAEASENPILAELVERIQLLRGGDPVLVDVTRARYLLEASANCVDVALSFYMEDDDGMGAAPPPPEPHVPYYPNIGGAMAAAAAPDPNVQNEPFVPALPRPRHAGSAASRSRSEKRGRRKDEDSKRPAAENDADLMARILQRHDPPGAENALGGIDLPPQEHELRTLQEELDYRHARHARRALEEFDEDDNQEEEEDDVEPLAEPPAPDAENEEEGAANVIVNNEEEGGDSVNISDDETAAATARWRIVGRVRSSERYGDSYRDHQNNTNNNDDSTGTVPDRRSKRKREPRARPSGSRSHHHSLDNANMNRILGQDEAPAKRDAPGAAPDSQLDIQSDGDDNDDNDDSDYEFSDALPFLHSPAGVLWGRPRSNDDSGTGDGGDNNKAAASAEAAASNSAQESKKNIIEGDEPAPEPPSEELRCTIPKTWLRAGFSLSPCGTGLLTGAPPSPPVGQRQARGVPPLPYHCGGVTAILSLVTALLYSGASIQGNKVNCNALRKPFLDLTPEERKQQFESRLADALSSLLHVAASAARDRRQKVLSRFLLKTKSLSRHKRKRTKKKNNDGTHDEEYYDDNDDDDDVAQEDANLLTQQSMERFIRLCRTCRWQDEELVREQQQQQQRTEDDADEREIRIVTSYNNIKDLRSYVLSTIQSYTAPGGCALLLENIVRIHGCNRLEKMFLTKAMTTALSNNKDEEALTKSFVTCTCEEKHAQKVETARKLSSTSMAKNKDMAPYGHDCASVELLSLLMTGRVHSSYQGWSADELGIGMLGISGGRSGKVGRALRNPVRPIWMLRGDTCYSTLVFTSDKDGVLTTTTQKYDPPGVALYATHWNCWQMSSKKYVNKSQLCIIPKQADSWEAPKPIDIQKVAIKCKKQRRVMDVISAEMKEKSTVVVSTDDEQEATTNASSTMAVVSKEETLEVTIHPDDQAFYPGDYRRWRFDMGGNATNMLTDDQKPHASEWIPYFRLNHRQKQIVEVKLAPRINLMLRTKWPSATVRIISPTNGTPPVV